MGHAVNEDRFRLLVDGKDVPIAKSYRVQAGVFEVPSTFEMNVGHNGLASELIANYAPFTPFELLVNDVKVMQGEIDDTDLADEDATSVKITGRDRLARLLDTEIDGDRTFSDKTFTDLLEEALADVGLGDVSVVSDNLANRKAITGTYKVQETVNPSQESTDEELAQTVEKRSKTVRKSLVMEAGTTWWDFLIPQCQRGGLFIWADVFGGFVLGQPNGKQPPLYRILRRRNGSTEMGEVTILGQPQFKKSARPRASEYIVQGRKGTGADGRGFASARKIDPEMVALLNPLESDRKDGGKRPKRKFYRDDKVKTPEQAAFLALRKMAQARREAFTLRYTLSGHTVQALNGGGRLVWQPDTTVHVVDEILGIDEVMYLDDCDFSRMPKSTVRVSVMRTEDLLFGDEDLLAPPPRPKKSAVRMGRTEVFRVEWQKNPTWGNLPTRTGLRLNKDGTGFEVLPGSRRRQ